MPLHRRNLVVEPRALMSQVERDRQQSAWDESSVRDLRAERPVTRGDCAGGERPCPWVSCRHNLFLDVHPQSGALTINAGAGEVDEALRGMAETCALDVVDRAPNGVTLDEVGELLLLTRERIRQIEERAVHKLRRRRGRLGEDDE